MAQREHDDLLTLAFAMESNPGAYALLIGAGVSKGAGLPTAWDVINDLTEKLARLEGVAPENPVGWYEDKFDEDASYSAVLGRMGRTRFERQPLLRKYFEPDWEVDAAPSIAHHAIADLVRTGVVKLIITLNFDRMIEAALHQAGIQPVVVVNDPGMAGLAPLHTIGCCVVHLHGDYLNPDSMLNTDAELGAYSAARAALLSKVLSEYGLIAVGWSATHDDALRAAIARDYPNRYTFTWIEPAEQTDVAHDLRQLKGAAVVRTDADDGLGRLADAVQSLRTRNARHPLTLATAVETAKRELGGGAVRVHLRDVLADEFRRLHELDDIKNPSGSADASYEDVVARIDEACSTACGLIATLAFWGTSETDSWWLAEMRRFAIQGEGGGITALLQRRIVAGVNMFYSAGVAAVAAERYDLLVRMFSMSHHDVARGRAERLEDVFRGDRVPVRATGSPGRPIAVVEPILNEVLLPSKEQLDDWWQRFEILRSVHILLNDADFRRLFEEFTSGNDRNVNALRGAEEKRTAGDITGAEGLGALAREGLKLARTAMDELANRVQVGLVRVRAIDLGPGAAWGVPVVQQLVGEVGAEGFNHPLMTCGFAPNSASLLFALEGVGLAFGNAGRQRQHLFGPLVSDSTWLDDGS